MRITAGSMRGRTIAVPNIQGLRPTSSRVREALFNILGDVQGDRVLDLFAGSGVMGIEALSRGASSLHSIESNRQACQAMQGLQQAWGMSEWQITSALLPKALHHVDKSFDLIFADPPYDQGLSVQIPAWLASHGIAYQRLIIEESSRAKLCWQEDFMPESHRKYGESTLYFFSATK
ncbi:MAG: 16S rRNA (guanine(966)-N(2))-methyltransferase RsmD, partial [Ghiorsea sp.]